ncbi:hypothetical protein AMEX_G16306 [Astyanax mexicanus]|uniref:Uncharacterized protein n=1 Tax=Astyanax mexicanus TaxID=7994 RepID=A0A8T2LKB7_ASTMX|nr:hypothetical protein AMEX_G16306 [Astyanax mexicanus]
MAVMLLLGVVYARRRCDYSIILSSYRLLIFPELQSLNLTGPFGMSKENNGCASNKVTHILRSIYRMTEQFVCLTDGLQGNEMTAVVSKMAQLIQLYCRKKSTENGRSVKPCKPVRRKKKAKKQMEQGRKMIQRLINCWQKLQSVYS